MQLSVPFSRLLRCVYLHLCSGLLLVGLSFGMVGASLHAHAAADATLTVTDCTGESGQGQIGTILSSASAGDTITFSCSGTIPITSTLVISTTNLTIDGSGQMVTLDGGHSTEVLFVNCCATFTLNDITIADGYNSNYLGGGGLLSNLGTTVNINNSTFINNVAYNGDGGGINNEGTVNISNSTFTNNMSAFNNGGGLSNEGTMSISNSTVTTNSALSDGGGLYNWDGTMSISNSTITTNSADNGGGLDNFSGTVNFTGSIVAENTAQQGNDCYNPYSGTLSDNGYNLESGTDCDFTGTGSLQNSNPQFDPNGLQNNGGLTSTIALAPDSPAVDHIPVGNSCPVSDQRGVSRPQGPECDIGAFEMTIADGLIVMTHVVNSFHLSKSIQDTLDVELLATRIAAKQGKTRVACASLDVFTGEVKLLTGHGITSSQATQLLNEANVINARFSC